MPSWNFESLDEETQQRIMRNNPEVAEIVRGQQLPEITINVQDHRSMQMATELDELFERQKIIMEELAPEKGFSIPHWIPWIGMTAMIVYLLEVVQNV